ncbi:hypothetical protein [Rhodoferax ferrireducens]|uniref:hypothetical protein n=1 Tax=Rhodoferax ferrireducens TaxID=192843 RepID=UPI000E0DF2B5|nr:hypothetical protein [Rhodoferax ferrireducens]
MANEKSYSERSLEQAAQRKLDFDHGYRNGGGFNYESGRGAAKKEAERRDREAFDRHIRETPNHANTGYAPYTRPRISPASRGRRSKGEEIAAWLNHLPSRCSSGVYWIAGTFIALVGYGVGLYQGATHGDAAIYGLVFVAAVAIAVKLTLFLLGLAVILTELAIKVTLVCTALYFGYRLLGSAGYF